MGNVTLRPPQKGQGADFWTKFKAYYGAADQIPILGDIPLIGRLFQSKGRGSEKTSLLIFMTSRLIKPDGSPIRENVERGIPAFRY